MLNLYVKIKRAWAELLIALGVSDETYEDRMGWT